jgi:uncharacterized protein (DUF2126 family)/transglutaminase-like putative cysteine protease
MPLTVALTHQTHYRYDRPTRLGPQSIRLRPAPHCRTPILAYSLSIAPKGHFIRWQQDPFGNYLARVVVEEATEVFSATVDLIADLAPINPFDFFVDEGALSWPFAYAPTLAEELAPYRQVPPDAPLVASYLQEQEIDAPRATIDFICDLNRKLSAHIAYKVREEPGVQTPQETLTARRGSCRDSAWLLVALLRRAGLAARFVSGYLLQLIDPAPAARGGLARDAGDLHAWAEVYIPGAGWIGLDPTSGLLASEGHLPLAASPSPAAATPISGTLGEARVEFSVAIALTRVEDTPRPANPYDATAWAAIVRAGQVVEERLRLSDVRLSTGGEPTFVALADPEAAEWKGAALGPTKRAFADRLARRLSARFASGGLLHHGLGKWYPGEPTPRWAVAIFWRSDGALLWRNGELIAEEHPAHAATIADAGAFADALAAALGLAPGSAVPAYEDVAHYLLAERKLPIGVAPSSNNLSDAAERERLARVFEAGLGQPAGFVLPLRASKLPGAPPQFATERWALRREALFLLPGDLPIGLRLPLGSLPELSALDYPAVSEPDPLAAPGRLAEGAELLRQGKERSQERVAPASAWADGGEPVRTALVLEPRAGHLCVFLPPLGDGEDYVALIAAIEATSAALGMPVRLEGYAPPFDARLNVIKITPDPGVIEVNVHPARSWEEAIDTTTAVYEAAGEVGLGAEKFLSDGGHVGTGGGNHIVLGGITPADSPFLRRPDLLASFIAYWQNHPALSYLFAGLFVGPTSQAPRADEARREQLSELEIALRGIPAPGGAIAPWLVDRLFRNLLVDVTGNTHRAEICIDKLYAPEGPTGRLGLVEFRAFEMPPNARMSLAEQLLMRALVACFWEKPYRARLVRWGGALHDRFMLPHVLWADFQSVIADLSEAGLPLEARWFLPHFEFRFPRLGAIAHAGVTLELRRALEPWLVLGETGGPSGTTRPVDSSLERIEVLTRSANPERYRVLCNGYAVPLTASGRAGEAVAGVRFRAWQPTHGFHPTIPAHVPLTFDIFDVFNERAIGGCRYHAGHPGGHGYPALPINAREAEARRVARFERLGHSPGSHPLREGGVENDAPMTLDLRRIP